MRCDKVCDNINEKTSTGSTNATSCDMSLQTRCRFPRCAGADDNLALRAVCFQAGGRPQESMWPPEIGSVAPCDPCASQSIGVMGGGVVYAIGPTSAGPLKIGSAGDVVARLLDLQVGNWRPLRIFGSIYCGKRSDASFVERQFHLKFSDRRIAGSAAREWFDVGVDDFERAAREIFNARI